MCVPTVSITVATEAKIAIPFVIISEFVLEDLIEERN